MAIIKLSLENFESLRNLTFGADGYYPVTFEQIEEHSFYPELTKILKAVKPDFNENNVFSIRVNNGYADAVYGFSLVKKNGKAVLQFGTGDDLNEVEIAYKIDQDDDSGEDVVKFKAGLATLEFKENQGNIITFLRFGKNQISIFAKWLSNVKYEDLENLENVNDLTSVLDSFGVFGVKLTDLVRPYVRANKPLKPALVADVKYWEIQETHPEYGASVKFYISGIDQALTKDGVLIKNPEAVYVPANQMSAILIKQEGTPDKPSLAQRALEAMANGGKLQLIITSIAKKDPEKYNPGNLLKIVPGNQQPAKPALAPATTKVVEAVQIDEKELAVLEKF
ncbi:hypothetical protein NIES2100_04960 [Calothrix sp. NIES-2100]|uniref:hypothetical protein n=1 Tax=Calothrix sp. NIES-2100 TaxID=1954172 RepID=UPI000B5E071B|nr:hypothetical protein NIES2100_04960 [Calothrix sp. NIES-2100]